MTTVNFHKYTVETIQKRVRDAAAPEFDWNAILILGNGFGQYRIEEVTNDRFANNNRFREFLTTQVPASIIETRAKQAAFVKPIWVSGGNDDLLKSGVLVISAENRKVRGWAAYIMRRPGVTAHLGAPYEYQWNDDEFDKDIRTAFGDIIGSS